MSPCRLASVLFLVGCALDARGKNACRVVEDCPAGNACVDQICVAMPSSEGGVPDAPSDGGSSVASVLQVSAGSTHTCVLRVDGTIGCWGLSARADAPPGTF